MPRHYPVALSAIAISLFLLSISPSLVAAATPLQLDPGFGKQGVFTDPEAPHGSRGYESVRAMTVAPGRSIYVAAQGSFSGGGTAVIARYRRDGELERSFGTRGYLTLPGVGRVNALAADRSGRLLMLSHQMMISRIAGGRLDPSFGDGGSVSMAALGLEGLELLSLAPLPGGGVLAAGTVHATNQMVVVKLKSDGALDTSFNGTGSRVVRFGPSTHGRLCQVKVQGDGKVVLGGTAGPRFRPALARLLPDGTFDPSFGRGGRVLSPRLLHGVITALTVRRDGSILAGASGFTNHHPGIRAAAGCGLAAAGREGNRALLLRFGPGGALDRRFGSIAAPRSRNGLAAIPIAVMRAQRHIFLVTSERGPAIRAYRSNGKPLDLGRVSGVPQDVFFGLAAAPQDRKLVIAWTPVPSSSQGEVNLARFTVR
ncbi:MAG TPA: hypothetical protein VH476_04375 [Solirubrobacterales bacterium]|jgi:uncharacterized delta-60 repeat protein